MKMVTQGSINSPYKSAHLVVVKHEVHPILVKGSFLPQSGLYPFIELTVEECAENPSYTKPQPTFVNTSYKPMLN